MVKYWIIPITYENWLIVKKYKIYGCRTYNNPRNVYSLIRKGDYILFYVKKEETKYSKGFVALAKVVSNWFLDLMNTIWSEEKQAGKVVYPHRIKIEIIQEGFVPLSKVVDKLSFIKNKERPQVFLSGTPANFRKPIPEEDAKRIVYLLGGS